MQKKYGATLCGCLLPFVLCGQPAPSWMNDKWRETSYPAKDYFVGFVSEAVPRKANVDEAALRIENEAKREVAESIVVRIKATQTMVDESVQQSMMPEQLTSFYHSTISTSSDVKIPGLTVESYYSKAKKRVYAFACVSKHKLRSYYAATVSAELRQAEGDMLAAARLEKQRDKANARRRYREAANLLENTASTLSLLLALDANPSARSSQLSAWQTLRNNATLALTRLEPLVYVSSREALLGQPCSIVADKLKAALTGSGYRLVENPARADFTLTLNAATQKIGNANDKIVFCSANVVVEWMDVFARKSVYREEFSANGGSTSFERAGREALEEAAAEIAEKLNKFVY
jgi:hypothetical protein